MKILGTILCLVGIALVSCGVWNAQTASPVEQSARRYLDAMREGHAAGIIAELSPEIQNVIAKNQDTPLGSIQPDPELQYKIVSITQNETLNKANVVAEITNQGYRLRPILHFEKQNNRWCIVGTSNVKPDPRWELRRLARVQKEQQSLADEVQHRLKDVAGVQVQTLK